MGFAVFLLVVIGLLGTIHLYLWQRLVRDTVRSRRWRRIGGLALLAGLLLILATVLAEPGLPRPVVVVLTWTGYLWLGLMFYLLIALLLLELPVSAAALLLRRRERREPPVDPSRRRLLRQGAAVAAGVAAISIGGYGVSRAYRPPKVTRLAVPLARLDPRADGLRVAVVSDIHVSPTWGARFVERVVEVVNGLDADLITVVGDMTSSEVEMVRESVAPLRRLRSRYGAFFVTGNHEYYTGYQEWIDAAEELGLRVLRNERVEIAHRGGAIDLAGVNDQQGTVHDDPPDYAAALGDRDPSRPVLLMAHQPVQVHEAARYGVDLQLSGHTHGGQVYPFDLLVRLQQPVVDGLAEVDGTLVYVTNGAGFWGPPMRVGADPEVTLLELRAR
ncbi:MAG TPA: metallophosphoesterase [Natronosporangium sp.]